MEISVMQGQGFSYCETGLINNTRENVELNYTKKRCGGKVYTRHTVKLIGSINFDYVMLRKHEYVLYKDKWLEQILCSLDDHMGIIIATLYITI